MPKNTRKYKAVVMEEKDGNETHSIYHIWASDCEQYAGFRIISACGPNGLVIKDHWLSKQINEDEEYAAIEERVRSWHPEGQISRAEFDL